MESPRETAYIKQNNATGSIYQVGGSTISDFRDGAVYLLDLGELVLIDSGAGMGFAPIVRNIEHLGFHGEDIAAIILTHCHFDHVGGAARFKAEFGTRLIMHALDADIVERGDQRLTAAFCFDVVFEPLPIDQKLYGKEEVIRFGEFVIHCLHTPGHSAGSISPYLEINGARVLFAQDISAPPLLEFSCDPLAWRRSLDKLIALEADILCDGHTGVYRPKSRVKAYFQRILRTAESR